MYLPDAPASWTKTDLWASKSMKTSAVVPGWMSKFTVSFTPDCWPDGTFRGATVPSRSITLLSGPSTSRIWP